MSAILLVAPGPLVTHGAEDSSIFRSAMRPRQVSGNHGTNVIPVSVIAYDFWRVWTASMR
ncbi:hypothetical protein HDIA_1159 [Hartmannibacter diazotrophicus]|uniref:Uncharacterized protein n=1 Tax=Hartmannibacter diazotrophicus TaxID=1482074 RepID=A0A2C9D361_9HYPH|nr:hypothetical protein HDIA_1159 [Hartmannibacter diazotrophicus]